MGLEIHMKGSGGINPLKLAKVQIGEAYKLLEFDEWSRMEQTPDDKYDPPPIKLFEGMSVMIKVGGKRKIRYMARVKTSMNGKQIHPGVYKAIEINGHGIVLVKQRK